MPQRPPSAGPPTMPTPVLRPVGPLRPGFDFGLFHKSTLAAKSHHLTEDDRLRVSVIAEEVDSIAIHSAMDSDGKSLRARAAWARARTRIVGAGDGPQRSAYRMRLARGIIKRAPLSPLAKMLSSSSHSRAAVLWSRAQLCSVVVSLATQAASTVNNSGRDFGHVLNVLEAGTSLVFFIDYALRLWTCPQKKSLRQLAPMAARMRWATSRNAILSAMSCVPVFVDGSAAARAGRNGWQTAVYTTLSLTPVLLLMRTAHWRAAVRTARRVVYVNRHILNISFALVSLTVLLSATMLYVACAHSAACVEQHGIGDLPTAVYVASMMLTGQDSPDGDLAPPLRVAVFLTAFLSVPFFAVPAAMLTWGFEGEAQVCVCVCVCAYTRACA